MIIQYSIIEYTFIEHHRHQEDITMRSKLISIWLLLVLLASAACAPQAAPAEPTSAPAITAAAPTTAPAAPTQVAAPTAVAATAAPTAPAVSAKTLTVLAAASLTESFGELGKTFETQNPGVKVAFSFAGSQQLAQQLDQGADADVFASASKKYMDAAVTSKRVNTADAKTFVKNRLVVIFPKANPAGLKTLKDLAKPGLKLDLEDKSVPAGQYSLDFLDKAVKDPGFDAQYKDNVLKNVVSYEDNVKSVVSKVSLGEVDAGIVYVTDVTADVAPKVDKLDIPDALNTVAVYPIAPISDSKNADLAKAFVALVLSPDGQSVMAKYGFIPAASK
jgi:molybdate transport system substrate-binding protein